MEATQPNQDLQHMYQAGVEHLRAGRWLEAESTYRRVMTELPGHPGAHYNLGMALKAQGKTDEAIAAFRVALALRPDYPDAANNLSGALAAVNRTDEAIAVLRAALALRPDLAALHNNLGILLRGAQRQAEAVESFGRALTLRPNFPEACNNLGAVLNELHQPAQALEAIDRALALLPDFAQAYVNRGNSLQGLGRSAEAIAAFQRALALRPQFPEAWNNLGGVYERMSRPALAMEAYRQAVTQWPDYAEAWNNLGNTLRGLQRNREAIAACRRALALQPDFPEAWNNLGNALCGDYLPVDAIAAYRRAAELRKDFAQVWGNLAVAMKDTGQLDEALACFDKAISLRPDDVVSHDSRLCTLHYHSYVEPTAIFQEARRWNERFARPVQHEILPHDNDPSPQRRLRIGYVSPDFRRHCQVFFTAPLFSHHDHEGFEIFCYSNVAVPDATTRALQHYADKWRDIAPLSDAEAERLIHDDGIDILMDLTLHTAGNRLGVFARKPAPVQATWIGYPGTTGLDAIDYRLTDPRLDPQQAAPPGADVRQPWIGARDDFYAERSVYLPDCFWCFDPRQLDQAAAEPMPAPGPLPALTAGHITFGCLNTFCKVTDQTLDLWARVMSAVPDSRLILMAPPGPHRERVVERLGLGNPGRVRFVLVQPREQYLATYRQIDLCLDTVPCNGHTTSFDALWMGVPVLTRLGPTVVGRAGWSLSYHLGLMELVTRTDDEYVRQAVAWTADLQRLSAARASLRERMESSPLMDGVRFTRNMEAAYLLMWREWATARAIGTSRGGN